MIDPNAGPAFDRTTLGDRVFSVRAYLYLLVFGVGAGALAIELAAARLLDPWFGNSQIVWAALISLVLACLALGAWIGGRVGDRSPRLLPLLAVVTVSGVATAVIPVMAQPVLQLAIRDLLELEAGLLLAAMLAVAILLTFPLVLLGAVTPWVVRIALSSVNTGGRTAGSLYAVGTVGSILGTLAPVLWLVPSYGTRRTFLLIGLWLVLLALCGAPWVARRQQATGFVGVLMMAALLGFDVLSGSTSIRPGPVAGSVPSRLLHEEESRYNYITVREAGGERWLKLNEGNGVHSVWHPDYTLSHGIWDYFLLAPWFSANPPTPATARVLVIGLAAGTVSSLWTDVYGPAPITGVELDPAILEVGREWFAMDRPNLTAVAADGRQWLSRQASSQVWDVVLVDAYRVPYIPFHLTTVEWFELVDRHLAAYGVVAVNVGRTETDLSLVTAMVTTMSEVWPQVFVLEEPVPEGVLGNVLVVGVREPANVGVFADNIAGLPGHLSEEFRAFAATTVDQIRVEGPDPDLEIWTDDKAPIERIVHRIVWNWLIQTSAIAEDEV